MSGLGSAEREGERLRTLIKELDLEPSIDDRLRLSNQLIQPLLDNRAVAAIVHVATVSRTRRLPVNRHAETYGDTLPRRSHDEMKVARVKATCDSAGAAVQDRCLLPHRPVPSQRPLIQSQAGRCGIKATSVAFNPPGRCKMFRSLVPDIVFRRP